MIRATNVPDDWAGYMTTCPDCGQRYHESEGGCACQKYTVDGDLRRDEDADGCPNQERDHD